MRPDLYHIPRDIIAQRASPVPLLSIDLLYDRYPALRERRWPRFDGWIASAIALGLVSLYGAAYAAAPYVLRVFP